MTDNVTTITPQSIAADQEPERKVRTFRVLRRNEGVDFGPGVWNELVTEYTTAYTPDAAELGELLGEGDYLLIEQDDKYSFQSTYPMRVVADRVYRLADDETA